MALFGTNGVRGTLDKLTPSLAFDLCAAFATWCKSQQTASGAKIMLARDMRLTSPMLHAAAKAGILSSGADVVDIGLCSSPVAEFCLEKEKAGGLVIVTASHNPAEWNALKFVDAAGIAVSRERGEEIERLALSKKYNHAPWDRVGKASNREDASLAHAAAVAKAVDAARIKKRKLRIALDFGNGTSSLSRGVFSALGCETIALNETLDGTFPGRPSEPTEANVKELCKAVPKNSCDFGVAWDGDSDRVVFVDERGSWIVGDLGFALSAKRACEEEKGKRGKFVVTTVATSRAVEEACAPFGAATIYTKVGAPYLSEKMAELGAGAVSGGEEVGGIIWPRFSLAKDGIFAAAKIAEMVCEGKLSELVAKLPKYCNSKTKLEVSSPEKKQKGLQSAKKHAEGMNGRLTLVDGVRLDLEDGWVIVRASGTENAMRVFAEGKTQKRSAQLMKEFKETVEKAVG